MHHEFYQIIRLKIKLSTNPATRIYMEGARCSSFSSQLRCCSVRGHQLSEPAPHNDRGHSSPSLPVVVGLRLYVETTIALTDGRIVVWMMGPSFRSSAALLWPHTSFRGTERILCESVYMWGKAQEESANMWGIARFVGGMM